MHLHQNHAIEVVDFLIFDPGRRGEHHHFADEALKEPSQICLRARMTRNVLLTVASPDALTKVKQILAKIP
jgi:hypothetical protein